jgi:hypothetical protein
MTASVRSIASGRTTAAADMLAYYPGKVKKWLARHGGLTDDMKTMQSGPDLWAIVDPCPEEVSPTSGSRGLKPET